MESLWNCCVFCLFKKKTHLCLWKNHPGLILVYINYKVTCSRSLWHRFRNSSQMYNTKLQHQNANVFPSVKCMTATMLSQFLNLARWALKDIRRVCCWHGCKWKLVFCVCVAPLQQQDFSTRSTAKRQKQPRCCEPLGAPCRAQGAAEQEGVAGTDDHGRPVSRQPTQLTGRDNAGVIAATGNLKHRVDSVYIWLEVQLWRGSDVVWPAKSVPVLLVCSVVDNAKSHFALFSTKQNVPRAAVDVTAQLTT